MAELAPGTVIGGRFVLDRQIGQGGMGIVWAATHVVTGKPVALKMLKPERVGDAVVRARFLREARAVCAVRHPNIVEIHDVLEMDDGAPVMVMDLLRGESLGDRLARETRLPVDQVARILIPTVNAVGAAHAAGIVHRDLKPDNVFLADEDGFVVVLVLDFGIAKIQSLDEGAPVLGALTGTGALLGTPFYMAPEQIFGERDVDHRADVWAVGVILYECLSGSRPTQADGLGQILRIITTESIVPLELVAPAIPADVAQLVGRMLQRDRGRRPSSMAEVQAVLQRYAPDVAARSIGDPALDTRDRRALVSRADDVSPTAATLASTTASTTADRAAPVPRSRAPLFVAAAAALAVVAGAASLYLAKSPPAGTGPTSLPVVMPPAPAPPTALATVPPAPSTPAPSSGPTQAGAPPTAPAKVPMPRATARPLHPPPAPSAPANPHAYDHM